MKREAEFVPSRPSAREMLAAWICCGLIGVGGFVLMSVDHNRSGTPSVYAGSRIPGSSEPMSSDRSVEDEFADLHDLPDVNLVNVAATENPPRRSEVQQCWLRSAVRRLL